MKRYCLLFVCLIGFMACKKKTNEDDTSKNTDIVNFTQVGPTTASSSIITYFSANRKGNTFIVTVIDENNTSQTYFGNGTKWKNLDTPRPFDAAVSETGTVIYFEKSNILKRYDGSGNPETIALTNFNYSKVVAGGDGNLYVGSSNEKVYKSTDDGKTWIPTDIPQNRFNYSGNLAVGFFVHPDGKMYSYTSGGKLYQSTDAGKNWSAININIDYSNSGYTDIYSTISHDNNGNIYILGSTGVSIINTVNLSSRSVSFQSAGLNNQFERFSKFASDMQGVIYATTTNSGYDYEYLKQAAAIYKFNGNIWQKLATPYPYTGFSGMNIQSTEIGIISAANGLQSKGLYAVDASGKYTDLGTPQSFENQIIDMAPHTNGKVFCVMRHPTPMGSILSAPLNPAYPSLMLLENGQWKHTSKASNKVFIASNSYIYSAHNLDISISKDGGLTWQTNTIIVDDPLNLRNFLSAEALHFTELKGEIYIYFSLNFGGVGGAYTNYSWTKASLGSLNFDKLVGKAGSYRPSTNQIPLVTALKGTTGFFYNPFNSYTYIPSQKEKVLLTKDGGINYIEAGFILPFAGSNSGHYVAWGTGGFMTSGPIDPLNFSVINLKLPQGEIDMNKYNGSNYFKTWARFGIDNKLYINLDNNIYMSNNIF